MARAEASDPARWGQPRDLQPFSMGGGSAVAGLEGASGSIEGLGVAVQGQGRGSQGHHSISQSQSQSQGHAPPGFPLRPQQQRQKQQTPPFQAATAGVLSGVVPAPAPAPVSAASSQVSPAHRDPSDSLSNDREGALNVRVSFVSCVACCLVHVRYRNSRTDTEITNIQHCFLGLTWRKLNDYGKHWCSCTSHICTHRCIATTASGGQLPLPQVPASRIM